MVAPGIPIQFSRNEPAKLIRERQKERFVIIASADKSLDQNHACPFSNQLLMQVADHAEHNALDKYNENK
jgi:hypothetical protein